MVSRALSMYVHFMHSSDDTKEKNSSLLANDCFIELI
jgi:hypothetical protein